MNDKQIATPNTKPTTPETRVAVSQVLERLAKGITSEAISAICPGLTLSDVKAALEHAVDTLHQHPKTTEEKAASIVQTKDDNALLEIDLGKILIVDDLQLNRQFANQVLKNSEFTLSFASDGEEGLAKARAELPFLVLSDIMMPKMDGFELCEKLKADERTKHASVILITAHQHGTAHVSKGLDMGADDYISRPVGINELTARVRAVARLKRAEVKAQRQAQITARRNAELEFLNELTLIATSANLQKIFSFALSQLCQFLDAKACALLLIEGTQKLHVNIATRSGHANSLSVDFNPNADVTAQSFQEKVPLVLSKVLNDSNEIEFTSILDPPALYSVSMTSNEQVVGAIGVIGKQRDSLTAENQTLLNSVAGIVTVAVENARLWSHTRQKLTDRALLNDIAHILNSTLDLEQILQWTTQLFKESLQAEMVMLWLMDEHNQDLILRASSGPNAPTITDFRPLPQTGVADYVVRTGTPFHSDDILNEDINFEPMTEINGHTPSSVLCVPLQVKDQVIGAVHAVHSNSGWFDQNELRFLRSATSFIGIAVENAQLFRQVQEFNLQLEQMVLERTHQLIEEKEKTVAILASMADGLLVMDTHNHILTANRVAEEMLDFCLDELQGKSIEKQLSHSPLWRCVNDMAASDELTLGSLVDLPDTSQPDGVLSIQARSAKMWDETGESTGTVIVLRDITALKEVERMKARFMAGVTHELKTPLAVIQVHANNLFTYHARLPEHKQKELLEAIQKQVTLLEQSVEGILDLARMDTGTIELERQSIDVRELIDTVLANLRPLAEIKKIALHWKKPAAAIMTMGDSRLIMRIIKNLIDNAIKYTPARGSIEIQTFSTSVGEQTFVKLEISDTGIGILPEYQDRIFERFYRVDPSHTVPGTGLGLAIVKEIVDAHGGNVQVKSTSGTGSTFTVTLPGTDTEA
ncbi:MAG: GAF domain-containing protein [Chloroflexi bacterium]|nr:GAF domain-containing protein [Chloroflexota bacterium]